MDRLEGKKDIIGLFLKNGIMLTPEEAGALDEKNYMQVLEKKLSENKKDGAEVYTPKTGRVSCEDFIKGCGRRFEFLRGLLLKKTDAVSINKGKKVFSEATIIGRIKSSTSRGFVLEDITGETEVVSDSMDIKTGDVMGFRGFFRDNSFFPNQTMWPDIPLESSPKPVHMKITLTSKMKEGMPGTIICPGAMKADNIITGFSRIGTIKISRHGRELFVLAYAPVKETTEEEAIRILKKRTLPDEGATDNVIEDVPGIFWLFGNGKNWTRNYRGVVIISTDADSFAEYDGDEVVFGNL